MDSRSVKCVVQRKEWLQEITLDRDKFEVVHGGLIDSEQPDYGAGDFLKTLGHLSNEAAKAKRSKTFFGVLFLCEQVRRRSAASATLFLWRLQRSPKSRKQVRQELLEINLKFHFTQESVWVNARARPEL